VVTANLAQREAERSYGLSGDQLTPAVSWSAFALRKRWNQTKDDIASWWPENSKEAYSSGLANLATALDNWKTSKTGARTGPTVRPGLAWANCAAGSSTRPVGPAAPCMSRTAGIRRPKPVRAVAW